MSREKNKLTSTDYELLEYIKENIMKNQGLKEEKQKKK